jgi:hypothetical protein
LDGSLGNPDRAATHDIFLYSEGASESTGGVIGLRAVVVQEDPPIAAVAEDRTAARSDVHGCR